MKMKKTYAFETGYYPRRGETFGPRFATEEEAREWIAQYERAHGCEPGCDHGFGTGSGFDVEEVV
jgi:hypothetical protein